MDNAHTKVLSELDGLLKKAPDVDMAEEMKKFVGTHASALTDAGDGMKGLVAKLLLANAIAEFQYGFMVGCDVTSDINFLLRLAASSGHGDLLNQFGDNARMEKMSKILEEKSMRIINEGQKKTG